MGKWRVIKVSLCGSRTDFCMWFEAGGHIQFENCNFSWHFLSRMRDVREQTNEKEPLAASRQKLKKDSHLPDPCQFRVDSMYQLKIPENRQKSQIFLNMKLNMKNRDIGQIRLLAGNTSFQPQIQ
ncbi:hypothetical protein OUZ56_007138 [Daphnia magna]|uniref:Uncharacterized protein n=1 Tax=Daphnia magna TaxID=35525 RepID=A0ABQ9YYY8_9CRUS|nr:hypothetical protein OUZ56_007138 [Daphnia magna]